MSENETIGTMPITVPNKPKDDDINIVQGFKSEDIGELNDSSGIIPQLNPEELETLNYAELHSMYNNIKNSMEDAAQLYDMINEMQAMQRSIMELNSAISESAETNTAAADLSTQLDKDADHDKQVKSFLDNYPKIKKEGEEQLAQLDAVIKRRYGDTPKTSTFITAQMMEVMDKRMSQYDENIARLAETQKLKEIGQKVPIKGDIPYMMLKMNQKKDQMMVMKGCFEDRADMKFWIARYSQPFVIQGIWKDVRKNYDMAMKDSVKYLMRFFKPGDIEALRNFMLFTMVTPGVQLIIACIIKDLSRIIRRERDTKKDWYARTFIMNVLDFTNGVYDFHNDDTSWLPRFMLWVMQQFAPIVLADERYIKKYIASHRDEAQNDLAKIDAFKNKIQEYSQKESDGKTSSEDSPQDN